VEKITDTRVIAIAQNDFAFQVRFVIFQFLFDVGELRVKLILFRCLCFLQKRI
jgi:hypothetical protein